MIDNRYSYITCGFCHGKFQATKQIPDPSDETGQTMITVDDQDELKQFVGGHWSKCTEATPYTDPNATYQE